MSAIAAFTLLPLGSIDELRDACVTKTLSGKVEDRFWDFLSEQGKRLTDYDWSGYILATLLPYLEQMEDIHLMKSEFEDLSSFVCNTRETTAFVLTSKHREEYLNQLDPASYSESELRTFYEDFNETKFDEAGKAMLDGIALFHTNLAEVSPQTIILVTIG